jgi:hypothetical protein
LRQDEQDFFASVLLELPVNPSQSCGLTGASASEIPSLKRLSSEKAPLKTRGGMLDTQDEDAVVSCESCSSCQKNPEEL